MALDRTNKPLYQTNNLLNGKGKDLYTALPEDLADANAALAESLKQVKDVFSLTAPQLATASTSLETTKGLDLIDTMTEIPQEVTDYFTTTYGTGTGASGQFLMTDLIGTAAGHVHNDELPIVEADLNTLDALGELANIKLGYENLVNIDAGNFNVTGGNIGVDEGGNAIVGTDVLVPGGPGAGLYEMENTGDPIPINEAATAVLADMQTELLRLKTEYPTQSAQSIQSVTNSCQQMKREKELQAAAGIVPSQTQTGQKTAIVQLAQNLHDYGQDDSLGGTAQILEACAQTQDIYGQAIIAATREGRNLTRRDDQGMGNSMFAPAQTRVTQKASLGTSTYTVEEAKNNIK